MPRSRAGSLQRPSPEAMLEKASLAKTAGLRARYAQRGLELSGAADPTLRVLLLRQLYLAAMDRRRFSEARALAHEMLSADVLVDAAHEDAARACLGQRAFDGAVRHLRLAARHGPASRRAFHCSALGALLYLNGRAVESLQPLRHAVTWSTTDKAICRGQLLLAELEAELAGATLDDLTEELVEVRADLEQSPQRRGYSDFVLGELCLKLGDDASALEHLERFVKRVGSGRVAMQVALDPEIGRAKRDIGIIRRRRS